LIVLSKRTPRLPFCPCGKSEFIDTDDGLGLVSSMLCRDSLVVDASELDRDVGVETFTAVGGLDFRDDVGVELYTVFLLLLTAPPPLILSLIVPERRWFTKFPPTIQTSSIAAPPRIGLPSFAIAK
jgi:hypothetical protein